jgi:TonB family protein
MAGIVMKYILSIATLSILSLSCSPTSNEGHITTEGFIKEFQVPAQMIFMHPPEYPRLARQAGLEATLWVTVLVQADGSVKEAGVHRSSGSRAGFDEAAVSASYKCMYNPAQKNGQAVESRIIYRAEFRLVGPEAVTRFVVDNNMVETICQ